MWTALVTIVLSACAAPSQAPPAALGDIALSGISTDSSGRCFARQDGETETTVVTETIEVVPEVKDRNGVVTSPAIFRSVTRPQTVQVTQGEPFQIVCPQVYTSDFVSTLQRALIVRRAYTGPVSGVMDATTQAAVQAFQQPMGIDSPLLSIRVARDLGIVAVPL